jgi:hypothetical protein
MSKGSQKLVPSIDLSAMDPEDTNHPETESGKCLPAPSRDAHLRAIHESIRANAYVVPAGLVAERMLEEVASKHGPED